MLLARDQERLTEAAQELRRYGVEISTRQCDVTQAEQARRAITAVMDEFKSIDVLVNNAGIIQVGAAENMNRDDYTDALAVHFWAPLNLTAEVLPYMKGQGSGRIVNITSIGGKVAVHHLAPYVASKFALAGFSEAMRAELIKDGIYVTTVVPGLMRTGSHINAFFKGQHQKEFALFSIANASPLFSIASERAARQGDSPQPRRATLCASYESVKRISQTDCARARHKRVGLDVSLKKTSIKTAAQEVMPLVRG